MDLKKTVFTTSFVALLLSVNPTASIASEVEFCYGPDCSLPPEQWEDEFPDCGGDVQSPIDIFGAESNPHLPKIHFHYRKTELVVKNNGHTTEIEIGEDSDNYITIDGEQCDLLQLHFHTRSEHNFGGSSFPMETHFVHQCESGRLAVIGVKMHYTRDNPNRVLNKALTYAPYDDDSEEYIVGTEHIDDVYVHPKRLIPSNRKYSTYEGSLTTPPCSEVVDWYVLNKSMGISMEQMEEFQQILTDTSPDHYPFNNRPLQDLNDRFIEARF